jgi:hypothetical protein
MVYGDKVFITDASVGLSALIQVTNGAMPVVWSGGDLRSHSSTPVLIGNHLYGFDCPSVGDSVYRLVCVDVATGRAVWSNDLGSVSAGEWMLTGADGKLFLISADRGYNSGRLVIAKATSSGYDDGGRSYYQIVSSGVAEDWYSQPVLCDGRLYVRSSGYDAGAGNWQPGKVHCLQLSGSPGDPPTDADADGIADTWEQEVFGSTAVDGAADADGDGFSNSAEYTAGTNPQDSNSVLRLSVVMSNGTLVASWPTVGDMGIGYGDGVNRYYGLQGRASLTTGEWTYVEGMSNKLGFAGSLCCTNNLAATGAFYRVRVQLK